jgi:hypothetical protein
LTVAVIALVAPYNAAAHSWAESISRRLKLTAPTVASVPRPSSTKDQHSTVEAEKFVLRDSDGKMRAELGLQGEVVSLV